MRWPPPVSARVDWAWVQGLPFRRRRLRRILRMLDGRTHRGGTLVDVGGGTGIAIEEAVRTAPAGAYARFLLLDPQRGMLERAAQRRGDRPRAALVRGCGERLPFADASVDILLSFGVLCCMQAADVPRAVSELWRVLRPGGYCLLALPRPWSPFSDPLFRAAGFRLVAQSRPGRVLYRRPERPPDPPVL